jgi:hypothetical protein
MVNALEALYVLTALAFVAAIVLHIRGRRLAARRLAYLGALGALLAIAGYWYLSSTA